MHEFRRDPQRILVFRPGSIGDTVVSLPALHMVRRKFPSAEIRILENSIVSNSTSKPSALLLGSSLISGYFEYRGGKQNFTAALQTLKLIRKWSPELSIYLGPARDTFSLLVIFAFLRACSKKVVAVPFSQNLRTHRVLPDSDMKESEAERLCRCLNSFEEIDIKSPDSWDLQLDPSELDTALQPTNPYLCLAIGTKQIQKQWGIQNWSKLLQELSNTHSATFELVALGSSSDFAQSEEVLKYWDGKYTNLCGKTNVRQSALILKNAQGLLAHDSGPMHLAASVATPVFALFADDSKRGIWNPVGKRNQLIYPNDSVSGIGSISVQQVVVLAKEFLEKSL